VSTVIGILLATGVVLGMAALSVDVGSMMFEKRQLQSGADAAALALAKSCGDSAAACTTTDPTTKQVLNDLNNANNFRDGAGGFNAGKYAAPAGGLPGVCGRGIASLPTCAAPTENSSDCPPLPDWLAANTAIPYVEVHTESKETNGDTILPTSLIRTLTGGNPGQAVRACSRAAWGSPTGGPGLLPITISGCDWKAATGGNPGGGGGAYVPDPVYNGGSTPDNGYGGTGQPGWPQAPFTPPSYNVGQEVILVLQGTAATTPACPAPPGSGAWSGHALPGGFGNVKTTSDPCQADVKAFHWVQSDTGNNTSCDLSQYVGKVVQLPVFDCTTTAYPSAEPPIGTCDTGNGTGAWYHLAGYASFYISGYDFNVVSGLPNKVKSVNPNFNQFPCPTGPAWAGARCMSGWFVSGELKEATSISAPPSGGFGTYVVLPSG
jgi:hypothetical protein